MKFEDISRLLETARKTIDKSLYDYLVNINKGLVDLKNLVDEKYVLEELLDQPRRPDDRDGKFYYDKHRRRYMMAVDTEDYYDVNNWEGARVYRSTDQTGLVTATPTAISFDTERYDYGGFWLVGNATRLTIPINGRYSVGACVEWASNSAGNFRTLSLRVNGGNSIAVDMRLPMTGGFVTRNAVHTEYEFVAGDYIEAVVNQDSGGNRTVNAVGNYSPEFWIQKLAGQKEY